jgi:hypothetical protein
MRSGILARRVQTLQDRRLDARLFLERHISDGAVSKLITGERMKSILNNINVPLPRRGGSFVDSLALGVAHTRGNLGGGLACQVWVQAFGRQAHRGVRPLAQEQQAHGMVLPPRRRVQGRHAIHVWVIHIRASVQKGLGVLIVLAPWLAAPRPQGREGGSATVEHISVFCIGQVLRIQHIGGHAVIRHDLQEGGNVLRITYSPIQRGDAI